MLQNQGGLKEGPHISQVLKEKNFQPRTLYPPKTVLGTEVTYGVFE